MARLPSGGGRKRRPRPSATQRARSQQQQYVSQGRAVQRAATQQRRSSARRQAAPVSPAFRPIASQSRPFRPQVARAHHKTRMALKRLPDHPAIPHVPVLGLPSHARQIPVPVAIRALERGDSAEYTSPQIKSILSGYRRAARKVGVKSINELFQLGSLRQRKNMMDVGRAIAATGQRRDVAARDVRDRVQPGERRSGVQQGLATINAELATRAAIPGVAQATGKTKTIGDLFVSAGRYGVEAPAKTIFNLGRATVEDPGAVAKSSARTAVESITGIPEAVKVTIDQVQQHGVAKGVGMTLEAMGKDYERRYGSILSDPAKFREQVKKDYGLTPFVFDAASVGAGGGQLAGALARSGAAGRAAAALTRLADKHPSVGARGAAGAARGIREAAVGERPNLRVSAGEGGVRSQRRSSNLFVGIGQSALDRSRRRAFTRQVDRAGLRQAPDGRIVEPEAGGGRLPALRPGAGEVLPKTTGVVGRSVRELPGLRALTGRTARDIGGRQSVTRLRMLTTRSRVIADIQKRIKQLSPEESKALKYAEQLGVRSGSDGVRALTARLAQMTRGRERAGMERVTPILADTNDEVRLLREILADPDRYLTPRLDQVADELRTIQLEHAGRDPELSASREVIARHNAQADMLGVARGPDVEYFRGVLRQLEAKTEVPGLAARADVLASLAPAERAAVAKTLVKGVRGDRKAAERAVTTLERRAAVEAEKLAIRERYGPRDVAGYQVRHSDNGRRFATEEEAAAYARSIGGLPSDVMPVRAPDTIAQLERQLDQMRGEFRGRADEHVSVPGVKDGGDFRLEALREEIKSMEAALRELRAAGGAPETAWFRPRPDARNPPVGRGFIAPDGKLHTWNEDEGTHAEMARARGVNPNHIEQFMIRTDGTLAVNGGTGRMGDYEIVARAVTQDPRLKAPKDFNASPDAMGPMDANGNVYPNYAQALETARAEYQTPGARRAAIFNSRQLEQARARHEAAQLEAASARATLDRARHAEKALKKVLKASKSKQHMRLESAETFVAKVRQAAEDAGLAEPAYWESAMRPPDSTAALAATGRGLRATARSKKRTGKIFEVGAEETSPDVFTRGVERNIKRRFQYALVQRNLETHAFEWSRGRNGEGLTAREALKVFDERRIDPRSVELINANYVHRRPVEDVAAARGDTVLEADAGLGEQLTSTGDMQAELAAARRRIEDVSAEAQSGQALNRYFVVPKDVADTTAATLRATDNNAWRAIEIILKQKPARIMLGAANVPWLAFQIASNTLLTGLGGGINPFNVHGAHKWWKSLEPDERDAIEAELGITHGHHLVGNDEPHLGATNSRIVNFWRAYKKTKVGRLGTKTNPLNVMFRADEAQNNFFRRVLFYDQARKQAYRRMGQSWKGVDRGIGRLVDRVLAKPPGEQAQLIARHSEDFEKVAHHVNDFLGDYLRFSPAERFLLSRNVMFYGYLRYSLRFTFYTMPVKHPVMTSVLSNLGRLGAQEIKDLFGVPDDYQLPTSMVSQVYFGDAEDAANGQLRSLPLGRFNPFLNTLTQLDGMQQATGVVSPLYQALVDQAFEESSFTGRDWRIEGRPTPSEAERPKDYFGSAWSMLQPSIPNPLHPLGVGPAELTHGSPRGRILERSILNLAYPARTAEQTLLAPNQSDDALLWQPHPMTYADPEAAAGVQASRDAVTQQSIFRRIGAKALPVFPQRTAAPAVVAREREKEAAAAERAKRKPGEKKRRKRKSSTGGTYGGGASSSSSNYGGASSSTAARYGG